jgi:hypothetical protein
MLKIKVSYQDFLQLNIHSPIAEVNISELDVVHWDNCILIFNHSGLEILKEFLSALNRVGLGCWMNEDSVLLRR